MDHKESKGIPEKHLLLLHEYTEGFDCVKVKVVITQSCLTLCNPMDCSPAGSSVHGILQARILEWVAISFSSIYLRAQLKKKMCVGGLILCVFISLFRLTNLHSETTYFYLKFINFEAQSHDRAASALGFGPRQSELSGEGNGNPLQCSCLENPMDRGAW